jgi:hypothetical protein
LDAGCSALVDPPVNAGRLFSAFYTRENRFTSIFGFEFKQFYMKKIYTLILTLLFLASGCAPGNYSTGSSEQVKLQHKTVAILPFDVTIDVKHVPQGNTQQILLGQQKRTGYDVQTSVYYYLYKEKSKNKYTVDFQDIFKTNTKLSEAGVSYETLQMMSKEEICSLLGVDAVISGKVITSRPMSVGAAVAVGALVGVWGPTNRAKATVTVHDKQESKLLWKYNFEYAGTVGSTAESLTTALMKSVSKNFPY